MERHAEPARRLAYQTDEPWVELQAAEAPALGDRNLRARATRALGDRRLDLALHVGKPCRRGMAKVDVELRLVGQDARQVGREVQPRRRRLAVLRRIAPADLIDGHGHVARRRPGRCGAGSSAWADVGRSRRAPRRACRASCSRP